ncbi:Piso0_005781 [Millerozyma farinosa CBS 7064]|uniref:ferric-chelate reductase (NADPH) n=1 Tax=Pichia sorbitophila (strain ATCC MYA-4447 / BCRC 22081 / CBS 7064 / NBRC 10061 / NRRL Y-12695) TaxID=559304 RepID=G8XZX9_PICSO|nr:Piso0_005781 [Millerozyma farinosa CBS 7064]
MVSAIPYYSQYDVEKERNNKFAWLSFGLGLATVVLYGILFHWIPRWIRSKRDTGKLKYRGLLKMTRMWDTFNSSIGFRLYPWGRRVYYFQPSLTVLFSAYLAIMGCFCFVQTKDLNYRPQFYIVSKRMGKLATGNLPLLNVFLLKHDVLTAVTGLSHDKLLFFHLWIGRFVWVIVTIHMALCIKYWIALNFEIMVEIPPQIFGMISYGALFFLTWASLKFIRKLSYDFFLLQHRILAFIMLLFAFFHNPAGRGEVIVAVHILVIDRVLQRILSIAHRKISPTKGEAEFKICDEDTIEITLPVKETTTRSRKWFLRFLPRVGTWDAGQHIYLNVGRVSKLQFHPFTIASLPNSGQMKFVIRKQKGFTKKLYNKIKSMQEADSETQTALNTVKMKIMIYGPYGGKHQPLISFDSVLFLAAGSGASFTLPLALDLIQSIAAREYQKDYLHRPRHPRIHIVWTVRYLKNIEWYRDILQQISAYSTTINIKIDFFITRESLSDDPKDKSSKSPVEKSWSRDLSVDSDPSSISPETPAANIASITYSRPDAAWMIRNHVESVYGMGAIDGSSTSGSSFIVEEARPQESFAHAVAVVVCGPPALTTASKHECQRNLWRKNAPNIYCLTESYE